MIAPGIGEWTVPGYTYAAELGSGASGRVVRATHDGTGTPVAIKYLNDRMRADSTFLAGFRAEAQLLNTFASPYVVRLYEYVENARGAAIVMELVDGIPLRALLKQEGPTGPEAALTVLKGSLLGLAAAHAAGVVHRDYKPDNVLVAADGSSVLVDFGIAVSVGEFPGVSGTPPYMAPEQWMGHAAGPPTDVYAATATFFECLTGAKPYVGDTAIQLAMQHMHAPIPDDAVPEPVRPLILRGLAKSHAERPVDAASFVEDLDAIAVAAYGEDWEERGQRKLAALAALLPLLFPSASGSASGTTTLATTTLRAGHRLRRGLHGKVLAGSAAVALLASGLVVTAVVTTRHSAIGSIAADTPTTDSSSTAPGGSQGSNAATPQQSGSTSATSAPHGPVSTPVGTGAAADGTSGTGTSGTDGTTADGPANGASPPAGAPPAGASPPAGAPPVGAQPPAAAPSSNDTPPGNGAPPSEGTPPGDDTPPSSSTPPVAPPVKDPAPTASASAPEPKLKVISAKIVASGPLGTGCSMVASVTVISDGAADGTLTLSWFHSNSARTAGAVVSTEPVPLAKGKTQSSGRYTHTFSVPDSHPYLGVQISTSPAADSGNGSFATIPAPSTCNPPR